jgi:hypothetical protein
MGADVENLLEDANTISDDISQSGAGPEDYQKFDTDLQTVAKDCGTTFQPLPKSLTGAS